MENLLLGAKIADIGQEETNRPAILSLPQLKEGLEKHADWSWDIEKNQKDNFPVCEALCHPMHCNCSRASRWFMMYFWACRDKNKEVSWVWFWSVYFMSNCTKKRNSYSWVNWDRNLLCCCWFLLNGHFLFSQIIDIRDIIRSANIEEMKDVYPLPSQHWLVTHSPSFETNWFWIWGSDRLTPACTKVKSRMGLVSEFCICFFARVVQFLDACDQIHSSVPDGDRHVQTAEDTEA